MILRASGVSRNSGGTVAPNNRSRLMRYGAHQLANVSKTKIPLSIHFMDPILSLPNSIPVEYPRDARLRPLIRRSFPVAAAQIVPASADRPLSSAAPTLGRPAAASGQASLRPPESCKLPQRY